MYSCQCICQCNRSTIPAPISAHLPHTCPRTLPPLHDAGAGRRGEEGVCHAPRHKVALQGTYACRRLVACAARQWQAHRALVRAHAASFSVCRRRSQCRLQPRRPPQRASRRPYHRPSRRPSRRPSHGSSHGSSRRQKVPAAAKALGRQKRPASRPWRPASRHASEVAPTPLPMLQRRLQCRP